MKSLYTGLSDSDSALCEVMLRFRYMKSKNYHMAAEGIDSLISVIDGDHRSFAEMIAITSYSELGKDREALRYARHTIEDKEPFNKLEAYNSVIRNLITLGLSDSIRYYQECLLNYIGSQYNRYEDNKSLIPKGFYDAMLTQRSLADVKRRHNRQMIFSIVAVLSLIVLLLAYFNLRASLRLKSEKIRAKEDMISQLNDKIDILMGDGEKRAENMTDLREQFVDRLNQSGAHDATLRPYHDLESYRLVNESIDSKVALQKKHWEKIEADVELVAHGFINRLRIIFPDISHIDIMMCCLIKLGMQTGQISIILGRAKSTISTNRAKLFNQACGVGLEFKSLDDLIASL